MKCKSVALLLIALGSSLFGQAEQSVEKVAFNRFIDSGFFGPRAGFSTLPNSLKTDKVDGNLYTEFGWQVDLRYIPTHERFVGYAEGALMVSAVESGDPTIELWGYFGLRKTSGFGIGMGPNFSRYGAGLGIAPHYMFATGNLLIPVMANFVITDNVVRLQLITGFSHIKK